MCVCVHLDPNSGSVVAYRQGCHKGYADIERKVPMRPDSIVRLYSMTKCIVSVAAAVCLEDGVLRLDDLVSKFIPAFADIKVKGAAQGAPGAYANPSLDRHKSATQRLTDTDLLAQRRALDTCGRA